MKKHPIYRIVKRISYRKTNKNQEDYIIEVKKKSFFFGEKWYAVKGSLGYILYFNSETEAVFAVKNLQMGNLIDGTKREVTLVLDFNYEDK